MSDSDEFEIDMGDSPPVQTAPKVDNVSKSEQPAEPKPPVENKKDEDDDEFIIEETKEVADSSGITSQMSKMNISNELQNSIFLFTRYHTIIINGDSTMTYLNNASEIYSSWGISTVYGVGYDFLITGGFYLELEEQHEDDKQLNYDPIYSTHYGTSRTFTAKMESNGTLATDRFFNMNKLRYMHWQINWYTKSSKNRVFVLGGQYNTTVLDSVEMYDMDTKKWVLKASMLSPRIMFNVWNIGDFIYAFYGFKSSQFLYPDVSYERYSISGNSWEPLEISGLDISSKTGVSIAKTWSETDSSSKILILGGLDTTNFYQTLHWYDPSSNSAVELSNTQVNSDLQLMMPKFVSTDGKSFNLIGGANMFRYLQYDYLNNQWSVNANESEVKTYIDSLLGYYDANYNIFTAIPSSIWVAHLF